MTEKPTDRNLEPFDPEVHRWPIGVGENPDEAARALRNAINALNTSGSQAQRKTASNVAAHAVPGDCLWRKDLVQKLNGLKRTLSQNAAKSENDRVLNSSLADDCRKLESEFESIANENKIRPERKNLSPDGKEGAP